MLVYMYIDMYSNVVDSKTDLSTVQLLSYIICNK